MSRPSVYLESKINALLSIVDFFEANSERRLVFLAQIDFWEWEMEELIFSVDNFKERSKVWEASGDSTDEMIRQKGIVVKYGATYHKRARRANDVSAPIERLNYVISRWNHLLDVCVKSLFLSEDKIEQFGLCAQTNLDKFKKKAL